MNTAARSPLSLGNSHQDHLMEWRRIELLCLCLLQAKQGPDEKLLSDLNKCQQSVHKFRKQKGWNHLHAKLSYLALDILACVYAPTLLPRCGWLFQDLQPSRSTQPNEAIIASILAIPDDQLIELKITIQHLEKKGLIQREDSSPYVPLQPDNLSLSRLMRWSQENQAPPGAYAVRKTVSWNDLVLPEEQAVQLKEYLYWIEHASTVIDQWGGQRTGGPIALFAGPSGTGKTLAASVLANVLGWPLFRVDLAALVSKYIGETEKNIGRLFDATHGRNVFLQFDEVDALMGKRGELKDARDRYANMEVSYLLARIEDHNGPCVLTTNLRSQIDKAFCRRFQMVIEFPRPDAKQRLQLWQRLLPPKAPLSSELDLLKVAQAIHLTGGQIRNAALHAAYLAAADGKPINSTNISLAIYRELCKEQAQVNTRQLGDLARFLPEGEALVVNNAT